MTARADVIEIGYGHLSNSIGVSSAATSMTVTIRTGAVPTSLPFLVTLDDSTLNYERVLVTAISGSTWTITRAQEGTLAAAHNFGTSVSFGATSQELADLLGESATGPTLDAGTFPGATDQAKLAAALAAATGVAGSVVRIPRDWTLTAGLDVPSGVSLVSDGATISGAIVGSYLIRVRGNNRIQGVGFQNTDVSAGNIAVGFASNATDVKLLDCRFLGNSRTQGVSINTTGIRNVLIQGCDFDGLAYGILTNSVATDLTVLRIIGNDFRNIYGDAIELNHPGSAYVGLQHAVIEGNTISVPDGLGTGSTAGFGIGIAGATFVTVANNVISEARLRGIHVEDEAKHITITGNVVHNARGAGVTGNHGIHVLDGDYISIVGNQVYDCEENGINLDFDATSWATATVVADNVVKGCGNIGIVASGSGTALDQIIRDNVSVDNTSHGIELRGSGRQITVDGNISRGNGGYGLRVFVRSGLVLGPLNKLNGNTSGDLVLAAAGRPMVVRGRDATFTATEDGSGATPWTDCFSLGSGASGQVSVIAHLGGSYASRTFDITWDGTTLAATARGTLASGAIGTPALQAASGKLQTRTSAAAGAAIEFDVQFNGLMLQGA